MKKSKGSSIIVDTAAGKFLVRGVRPPIQLRTSPRKKKFKLKKEIKRLEENHTTKQVKKSNIDLVKKKLTFQNENDDDKEKNSILYLISNDQQDNQLNENDLTNSKCNLCFVHSTANRALIFSPRSSRLTFVGVFSLIQISGPSANLHGYSIEPFHSYSIYNLSSQSLISIETSSIHSKTTFHENEIYSIFEQYHIQLPLPEIYIEFIQKLAKYHHGLSIFYIEQIQETWIESIKVFNNTKLSKQWLFQTTNNENENDDDDDDEDLTSISNNQFKQIWPGMGLYKDCFYRSIVYSSEIESTTDRILSRINLEPLIIFVCGAKDSGKSTYLRYLINKCLSKQDQQIRLSFLDCDLGQSEFTPSGTISLFNDLNQPLFGPSATHLKQPVKSFYFGNLTVDNQQLTKYLTYVKLLFDFIRTTNPYDVLLVNTMGWGADIGLVIMKELIDLIKPNIIVQLRSSNPYFRHPMPDINPQWSINASVSNEYREINRIDVKYSYKTYDYYLLLTPVREHSQTKSNLTRQSCLWSYFSRLETNQLILKPLIDYFESIQIFSFNQIAIGLLHKQIQPKYFLEILNGSIVALARIKHEMFCPISNQYPALIDQRANIECLGFGFVRSIDMARREIHVIIPDKSLSKTMINALVKGHDDCPEEFYFMSIDRWRGLMPPYVTGLINSTSE